MKIAVVGGGIFGCSIAWYLAQHKHQMDLFEKQPDILQAASGINQFRLHRGYHYPRSRETVLSSYESEASFSRAYQPAIMDTGIESYYAIAKEKSLTHHEQAKKIWSECKLEHQPVKIDILNNRKIAQAFKVHEHLIDPVILKDLCWSYMKKYRVNVHLNQEVNVKQLNHYDKVIVAAYAMNNAVIHNTHHQQYQFELCEKLVLQLPEKFKNKSIVILDGPFTCIDPYGSTGYHLMGNVVHCIHHTNTGFHPEIPEQFRPLLNKGVIKNPPITNIKKFLAAAEEFFPGIQQAQHIGSMYTIRTVLPKREHDDARPTLVEPLDKKTIRVFSGKLGTCMDAAEQVLKLIAQ